MVKSTHHQIFFPHPLFWLLPEREHGFVKLGIFWHEEHTCSRERFSHVLPLMNYSIRCFPLCTGYKFSFSLFCQKEEESLASFFFCLYFPLLDNYYQAEEVNIVRQLDKTPSFSRAILFLFIYLFFNHFISCHLPSYGSHMFLNTNAQVVLTEILPGAPPPSWLLAQAFLWGNLFTLSLC